MDTYRFNIPYTNCGLLPFLPPINRRGRTDRWARRAAELTRYRLSRAARRPRPPRLPREIQRPCNRILRRNGKHAIIPLGHAHSLRRPFRKLRTIRDRKDNRIYARRSTARRWRVRHRATARALIPWEVAPFTELVWGENCEGERQVQWCRPIQTPSRFPRWRTSRPWSKTYIWPVGGPALPDPPRHESETHSQDGGPNDHHHHPAVHSDYGSASHSDSWWSWWA